jgi:hypothetical protein
MVAILMSTMVLLPASAATQEETRNVSATIDSINIGQNITLRGSIRFPVTLTSPQEVTAGETTKLSLQAKPITMILELDLPPPVNQTIQSDEITITSDPAQVLLETGISITINFSTTAVFDVTDPASLDQSVVQWDYIFEKQNIPMQISSEATNETVIDVRVDTYVTPTISLNIDLENFSATITDFTLPNVHMLPAVSGTIGTPIEPSITPTASPTPATTTRSFLDNPFAIVLIALAIVFIVAATLPWLNSLNKEDKRTVATKEEKAVTAVAEILKLLLHSQIVSYKLTLTSCSQAVIKHIL